ncbi:MAG: inositol monophosphatase family protein [Leptolyngbya sp. SIOISBB]|nr:inositol monophosphatase family protein [Leptolyngbya sp. SIOISBB]
MSIVTAEENEAILQTLLQGGQQARQAALENFEVFEKGREDYVTTVDQALDRFLSAAFAQQFPSDGIVTEENQGSAAAFCGCHGRLWFIDPIDGTEDFINRGEHYSIMVGLLRNQQPQAGWVYAPAQSRLYWGGADWGLFQQDDDGNTLTLEPHPQALGDSQTLLLGDRDQRRFGTAIAARLPELTFDAIGSFGLKVLEVIKGQAGLYVYLNGRVKLWDTTGPLALAQAAGLICCDLNGHAIQFDPNSIYPQSLIHRQPIIVGWPDYIEACLPALREAVMDVRRQELTLASR